MKNEQDDKLDHLLRSKLTRKSFVLKDEYWENARRMVDESRPRPPKPNKYVTLIIAGITIALVSVATINYSVTKKQAVQKETARVQEQLTAADQPVILPVPVTGASQTMQAVGEPVQAAKATAPHYRPLPTANTPVAPVAAPKTNTAATGGPVARTANTNTKTDANIPAVVKINTATDQRTVSNRTKRSTGPKQPQRVSHAQTASKTGNVRVAQPAAVQPNREEVIASATPSSASTPVNTSNTTTTTVETGVNETASVPVTTETVPVVAAVVTNETSNVTMQKNDVASAAATLAVVQNQPLPAEQIAIAGLSQPLLSLAQSPVSYNPGKPARHANGFKLLEAGVTWYNPSKGALDNFNFHAAARYGFHIGRRTDLAIGIGYSRLHQSKGTRTYNVISYDLGEQVKTNGVNTVRLDYIELPVTVYYALRGRHGVTGGATFAYLVRSADLLKKPEQTDYHIKANGYFGAFSPFDVQLNVGYTYMLTTRIMLSGTYNQGLIDITKNNVFRSGAYNTNTGARISISYQLH